MIENARPALGDAASERCWPDRPLDRHDNYDDMAAAHPPETSWSPDWPSPEPARSYMPANCYMPPLPQQQPQNQPPQPLQRQSQQQPHQQSQRQSRQQHHQHPHQQHHQQSHRQSRQQPRQQPQQHPQQQQHQQTNQQLHQAPHQPPHQAPHWTPQQAARQLPLSHLQHHQHYHQLQLHHQSPITQGKSVNSKDALEDKKEESDLWETQAAFLGPNLWDKTLPYDPDLKVQEYVDLDEFLSENGMPGECLGGGGVGVGGASFPPLGLPASLTKRERSPSPSDCCSPDTINPPLSPADSTFSMASSGRDFDPRTRAFSDDELKPQPMIKKSRKQYVPDDLKDDKYWARRRKNNMAAKRSRDARRMKENQIALRAGYLEKENMGLRQEVELLKKENHILREKLSKFAEM